MFQVESRRFALRWCFDGAWTAWAIAAVGVGAAVSATAAGSTPPERTADLSLRVEALKAELESLRWYMGKPSDEQPTIAVNGATPREVYSQALCLLENANRLCFEHTREPETPPVHPSGEIDETDVLRLIEAALGRIGRVQSHYGFESLGVTEQVDHGETYSDIFQAVVQADRQMNLLLEKHVAPSDVFEEVTTAIGYAARLLETHPGATVMPEAPAYQAGMRPADVYRRLLDCMDHVHTIADGVSAEVMQCDQDDARIDQAQSVDVQHLASLIVAELSYLHSRTPDAAPPRAVYYVGRKFPADVYQRAGMLEAQLVQLARLVEQNPQWLAPRRSEQRSTAEESP